LVWIPLPEKPEKAAKNSEFPCPAPTSPVALCSRHKQLPKEVSDPKVLWTISPVCGVAAVKGWYGTRVFCGKATKYGRRTGSHEYSPGFAVPGGESGHALQVR